MENLRDEHIVCASCGASFLFSAGEAAVFAQRGLMAPKRCKECRQARKLQGGFDRSAGGGDRAPGGGGARPGGYGPPRGGARPPRYTGDVNEYRSPMQDRYPPPVQAAGAPARGAAPGGFRGPRRGPPRAGDDGGYRAPAFQGPREGGRPGNFAPQGQGGFGARADGEGQAPRRRPPQEMFNIVCNSCGANAEVPFRPAEGRDVFCQACYRARKPE